MKFDYSKTSDPRDFGELIPHNTLASVLMRILPGGVGEGGQLKRTVKGDAEMLSCEFVVVEGPDAKRKLWYTFIPEGTTPGQQEMILTNRGRLKNILESARRIKSGDTSEQALAAYQADLKDFDNIVFIAKIGVRKGELKNDGSGDRWPDKNYLAGAIGPDHKDWHPTEHPPPFNGGGAGTAATPPASAPAGAAPITPPKWAQQ